MNILYLEDDPNDAKLVERYISSTTHHLTLVNTLPAATAVLHENHDLILVDVRLGDAREGLDFVQEVRAMGYEQPIIAVTGLALSHDVEQCYQVGCTDILSKPYTINQLVEMLNKYTV